MTSPQHHTDRKILLILPQNFCGLNPTLLFAYETLWMSIVHEVNRRQQIKHFERYSAITWKLLEVLIYLITLRPIIDLFSSEASKSRRQMRTFWEQYGPDYLMKLLAFLENTNDHLVELKSTEWNLDWLLEKAATGVRVEWRESRNSPDVIRFIEAFCPECGKIHSHERITAKSWSYNEGPLAQGGGVVVQCPKGHVLFNGMEYIS